MFVAIIAMVLGQAEPMSGQAVLRKMIEGRRQSFVTADILWKRSGPDGVHFRRSRIDPVGNYTYEEICDPVDGIRLADRLGEPLSCSDRRFLISDGLLWELHDHQFKASVWRHERDPFTPNKNPGMSPAATDARTLALLPDRTALNINDAMTVVLTNDPKAFQIKKDGGLYEVSVPSGPLDTITWWIDPDKGYNPVRSVARNRKSGEVIAETTVELALYDDHVWFPARFTETFGRNATVYQMQAVAFDRPGHEKRLTPESIGVLPYSQVAWQGPMRPGYKDRLFFWDGTALVPKEEIERQYKAGELAREIFQDADQRRRLLMAGSLGAWPAWHNSKDCGISNPGDIDEWEKYVRRFCLIRKCDDRQKASAQSILDDCRKTATPILARIKTEQAKEKDAAKRDAMLSPIADIFNKNLVPRLDALLSIPQSQPTSQPTKPLPMAGR